MAKLRSLRQIHFVIATLLILTLASDKVALYGNVAFSFLVILILNVFFIRIEIFICSSTKFHPNWINSSYKTNLWRFYKLHILKEVHGRNVIYKNFHCQSLIFLFILCLHSFLCKSDWHNSFIFLKRTSVSWVCSYENIFLIVFLLN